MKNIKDRSFLLSTSIAMHLGIHIVVPIVAFLLIGLWLDNVIKSSPLFTIIGTIVGFIISIFDAYKMTKLINK